jgi:hypothetical protein
MEQAGERSRPSRPKLGEALREALAGRGVDVSLEDAARPARALLRLAEQDLLEPVERPEAKAAESESTYSSLDQEVGPRT